MWLPTWLNGVGFDGNQKRGQRAVSRRSSALRAQPAFGSFVLKLQDAMGLSR